MLVAKAKDILCERIDKLEEENKDLQVRLKYATEQWNIWCKAYNELVSTTNKMMFK